MLKKTLIKQIWEFKDGNYKIFLVKKDGVIKLLNYEGICNFIFENYLNKETIKKWKKIINLMKKAVEELEKEVK